MALPCPLLSSQDHCMNLNHPCNLDPILLSYKAFKGMVPQHVKNWPEYKQQVFGRELHFSRESKPTLQGQIRTESLSPQDHFRAILRFHQHGYLREGWHTECWPFSRWPSATGPLWKTTGWKQQHLTPNICSLCTTTTFLFPPPELLVSEWTDNQLQGEPAHTTDLKDRQGSMAASGSCSCWSNLTKRTFFTVMKKEHLRACCQV